MKYRPNKHQQFIRTEVSKSIRETKSGGHRIHFV